MAFDPHALSHYGGSETRPIASQQRARQTTPVWDPTPTRRTYTLETAAPVAGSGIVRTAVYVRPRMRCAWIVTYRREVSSGVPIVGTLVESLRMRVVPSNRVELQL